MNSHQLSEPLFDCFSLQKVPENSSLHESEVQESVELEGQDQKQEVDSLPGGDVRVQDDCGRGADRLRGPPAGKELH